MATLFALTDGNISTIGSLNSAHATIQNGGTIGSILSSNRALATGTLYNANTPVNAIALCLSSVGTITPTDLITVRLSTTSYTYPASGLSEGRYVNSYSAAAPQAMVGWVVFKLPAPITYSTAPALSVFGPNYVRLLGLNATTPASILIYNTHNAICNASDILYATKALNTDFSVENRNINGSLTANTIYLNDGVTSSNNFTAGANIYIGKGGLFTGTGNITGTNSYCHVLDGATLSSTRSSRSIIFPIKAVSSAIVEIENFDIGTAKYNVAANPVVGFDYLHDITTGYAKINNSSIYAGISTSQVNSIVSNLSVTNTNISGRYAWGTTATNFVTATNFITKITNSLFDNIKFDESLVITNTNNVLFNNLSSKDVRFGGSSAISSNFNISNTNVLSSLNTNFISSTATCAVPLSAINFVGLSSYDSVFNINTYGRLSASSLNFNNTNFINLTAKSAGLSQAIINNNFNLSADTINIFTSSRILSSNFRAPSGLWLSTNVSAASCNFLVGKILSALDTRLDDTNITGLDILTGVNFDGVSAYNGNIDIRFNSSLPFTDSRFDNVNFTNDLSSQKTLDILRSNIVGTGVVFYVDGVTTLTNSYISDAIFNLKNNIDFSAASANNVDFFLTRTSRLSVLNGNFDDVYFNATPILTGVNFTGARVYNSELAFKTNSNLIFGTTRFENTNFSDISASGNTTFTSVTSLNSSTNDFSLSSSRTLGIFNSLMAYTNFFANSGLNITGTSANNINIFAQYGDLTASNSGLYNSSINNVSATNIRFANLTATDSTFNLTVSSDINFLGLYGRRSNFQVVAPNNFVLTGAEMYNTTFDSVSVGKEFNIRGCNFYNSQIKNVYSINDSGSAYATNAIYLSGNTRLPEFINVVSKNKACAVLSQDSANLYIKGLSCLSAVNYVLSATNLAGVLSSVTIDNSRSYVSDMYIKSVSGSLVIDGLTAKKDEKSPINVSVDKRTSQVVSLCSPFLDDQGNVYRDSLYFAGTAQTQVLTSQFFRPIKNMDDFTIDVWVNPTDTITTLTQMVFALSYVPSNAPRILYLAIDNKGRIVWGKGSSSSGAATNIVISPDSLKSEAWSLITATKNSNIYTIYVDGVFQASATDTTEFYQANNTTMQYYNAYIGGIYNANASAFTELYKGYIAGVRFVHKDIYGTSFTPVRKPLETIGSTVFNLTSSFDSYQVSRLLHAVIDFSDNVYYNPVTISNAVFGASPTLATGTIDISNSKFERLEIQNSDLRSSSLPIIAKYNTNEIEGSFLFTNCLFSEPGISKDIVRGYQKNVYREGGFAVQSGNGDLTNNYRVNYGGKISQDIVNTYETNYTEKVEPWSNTYYVKSSFKLLPVSEYSTLSGLQITYKTSEDYNGSAKWIISKNVIQGINDDISINLDPTDGVWTTISTPLTAYSKPWLQKGFLETYVRVSGTEGYLNIAKISPTQQ